MGFFFWNAACSDNSVTSEATTQRNHRRTKVFRLSFATLICLVILAITLPNLGQIDLASHTTTYGVPDGVCIAVVICPLILIFVGAARWEMAECIGWALLLVVLFLRFV